MRIWNINILIGPQASGKSVAVKLLYFFKNMAFEMIKAIENGDTRRTFDKQQKEKFITYFPEESWPGDPFLIEYRIEENWIVIDKRKNKSLVFEYSEDYKKIFDEGRKISKDWDKELVKKP